MIRSDRRLSRMVSKHFYRKSQRSVFQSFHREFTAIIGHIYETHIDSEKIGITFPVIKIQVILNYKEPNRCLLGGPNALDTSNVLKFSSSGLIVE